MSYDSPTTKDDSADEPQALPVALDKETQATSGKSLADEKGTVAYGKRKYRKRKPEPVHHFPVQPLVVQLVKRPKSYVNHSYRDFSQVPPEETYVAPVVVDQMTFAQKIHHMLSDPENGNVITWMPHGRAFKITAPKKLEKDILPRYIDGHCHYSSFLTKLRINGFKLLTEGKDQGCHYHECFLRGLPHLCKYMPMYGIGPRVKKADPENEPDFYEIEKLFPLDRKAAVVAAVRDDLQRMQSANTRDPVSIHVANPEQESLPTGLDFPRSRGLTLPRYGIVPQQVAGRQDWGIMNLAPVLPMNQAQSARVNVNMALPQSSAGRIVAPSISRISNFHSLRAMDAMVAPTAVREPFRSGSQPRVTETSLQRDLRQMTGGAQLPSSLPPGQVGIQREGRMFDERLRLESLRQQLNQRTTRLLQLESDLASQHRPYASSMERSLAHRRGAVSDSARTDRRQGGEPASGPSLAQLYALSAQDDSPRSRGTDSTSAGSLQRRQTGLLNQQQQRQMMLQLARPPSFAAAAQITGPGHLFGTAAVPHSRLDDRTTTEISELVAYLRRNQDQTQPPS